MRNLPHSPIAGDTRIMPAYAELDEVLVTDTFEIRVHSVNRQDDSKTSYDWPKLKITSNSVDIADMLAEWFSAVGGEANGSLSDLLQNGLNHAISVAKDPNRVSADPRIKEFKASFRKALGAGDGETLADLKNEDGDMFEALKNDHIAKLAAKADLLG